MTKSRLEAFSDGVIAIIITIMVLELRAPEHADRFSDLRSLVPKFLCYVLSFVYVGIYWVNHHHLLHASRGISGGILWANLHLLFWLSLVPFVTAWMGENGFASEPTAAYGAVLMLAGAAYLVLEWSINAAYPGDAPLARAVGRDRKAMLSVALYAVAIGAAFFSPWASGGLYAVVAAMWLVPDRRIERALAKG
ncbi:MAG: DUF1211 domain-containing protein [Phycisphaerales bacterium]|nr:DUF1211 domain-containing protein [Phycisphaerales bacterium]